MVVGLSPSGHGIWGVLTEADDRLLCHECGRWYAALGVHVGMVHDGARAYRLAHGLPLHTPLTATALHEARSQRALSSGLVQQVEQHRSADTLALADPAMAGRGHRLRRRA